MSASIVICGTITGEPERKVSVQALPYTVATLRDTNTGSEAPWLLLAFDDDVQAELAAMRDGDEIEAAGELNIWRLRGCNRFVVTAKRVANASPEHVPAIRTDETTAVARDKAGKPSTKARQPTRRVTTAKQPTALAEALL